MIRPHTPIIVIAAAISISIVVILSTSQPFSNLMQAPRSDQDDYNECISASKLLGQDFYIKQPSFDTLPPGYNLQAIEDSEGSIRMYYSKQRLCPLPRLFEGQLPSETILVQASGVNEPITPRQFVENAFYTKGNAFPNLKELDINGRAGYGWHTFVSDIVFENTDAGPTRVPAGVEFYDEETEVIYSIRGLQSMEDLLKIAKSIP